MNNNKNTAPVRDKRRYKYGSISVAFTVVFIALVIAINLVISGFSLSGDLTVDLTTEEFLSIGDVTKGLLDDLGDDLDVTITFMAPRDKFDVNTTSNGTTQKNYAVLVRDLAEAYENLYEGKIKVEYRELNADPAFENKFLEESTTKLSNSSVIIEGKYHFRILDLVAFFSQSEGATGYTAFNGENRFTTAILQSSIKEPQVVTFTYNNGESVGENGSLPYDCKAAGLASVLKDAGFEIKTADLDKEELDERTKILVSFGPQEDLSVTEVDKITKYLAKGNSFIAFVDSSTKELKNFQALLNDYWGINYKANSRVTDETHAIDSADNVVVKAPVSTSEETTTGEVIRRTVENIEGGNVSVVMPNSVELYVREGLTRDDFFVETIFETNDTAVATKGDEKTEGEEIPLMLLSTSYTYGENNVKNYSNVMLVGSTEFAETVNLVYGSNGNRRVILGIARNFGYDGVAPDIDSKPFGSVALDIELGTAKTLTWVICTVAPAIVLIMGMFVFFKRRHL